MEYKLLVRNLSLENALRNVSAVVSSEYFGQYELWLPHSRITAPPIQLDHLGGWDEKNEESFRLRSVAPYLSPILNMLGKDQNVNFQQLCLMLNVPQEIRARLGLNTKQAEQPSMTLCMSVAPEERGLYGFNISNPNPAKKEKEKYNAWHKEVSAELQRILPRQPNRKSKR